MATIRSILSCLTLRRSRANRAGYSELLYDSLDSYGQVDNEKFGFYSDSPASNHDGQYQAAPLMAYSPSAYDEDEELVAIAKKIVNLMHQAELNDDSLQIAITDVVGERRWNRKLIEECLDNVVELVEQGRQHMGDAMVEALDKVTDIADEEFEFPRRHPESVDGFIAIVSVGVLAEMQGAWVLELLGFGEVKDKDFEGVVEEDEKRAVGEVKMLTSDKIVLGEKARRGSVADWWMREYKAYIPEGRVESFFKRLDMVDPADE
ncbi:hypothetical protein QBC40DRAFT_172880 [Triangularia verruculosa]|uniref:Uncharacterized protein n=1 Tax=Triangularia verruculosa TaxID=2587418 RepID=A0AAN6XJV2_9PEZI|nr:hypothetical protein QBC40DRAFT_172880 [Triangularia verruculosa]